MNAAINNKQDEFSHIKNMKQYDEQFKACVLNHMVNVLDKEEWARFRSLAKSRRSLEPYLVFNPKATPEILVNDALCHDGMHLKHIPYEKTEIGKINNEPVYYCDGEGIYVWANGAETYGLHSIWLTFPAYPPNW